MVSSMFYKFSERVFCLSTADTLREAIDGCCELIEARRGDLRGKDARGGINLDEQKKLQMHLLEELIISYLVCPDDTPEKLWFAERIEDFENWLILTSSE